MSKLIAPSLYYDGNIPHIIKYMGSKRNILNYVIQGINECYNGGTIVDLFAGSSILSGALRNQAPILSNDIQYYSSILAKTYLASYSWEENPDILETIIEKSTDKVHAFQSIYNLEFNYSENMSLEEFNSIEKAQRALISEDFSKSDYHLFAKNYSGTYWSYEQCLWIDAIRSVADDYLNTQIYYPIISSLMFAMSYNSQSTGHYAQFREANHNSSMHDIMIYRNKQILPLFIKKFLEIQNTFGKNEFNHNVISMDYKDCLDVMGNNSTVYADPPYCFVHYSRFYHAIETLVLYDYPDVKFKGRYRTDRHQSPFCIRTQVKNAFMDIFKRVKFKNSNLVLSYSNTGMIELNELVDLASSTFGHTYTVETRFLAYTHSTMGRKEDKNREVQECLILVRKK